jgi:transcriptional regulator with XRE-family HTH domain
MSQSCQAAGGVTSPRMATKAQHADPYRPLPPFLRGLREAAGLTQRELGGRLGRPQSWVYNCETGNRRVDLTEFVAWARACGRDPAAEFARFLDLPPGPPSSRRHPDRRTSRP